MSDTKKYSREEAALVLRRLAELQAAPLPEEALTRDELAQVAGEAGLDLTHLERALAEAETSRKQQARFAGLRLFVVVRRTFTGTLDRARLEATVALLNRELGVIGTYELGDQALSWFGRHVAVSIVAEGSTVSIQIQERFHNTTRVQLVMGTSFSLPAAGATLVAFANAAMEPLGFLFGAAIPAIAYGITRIAHGRRIKSTTVQLEHLGDQLQASLSPRALGRGE